MLPIIVFLSLAGARGLAQGESRRTQQQDQKALYGQFNIKPFKVIGNIYSVGMSETTSWLITTPAGHFLIDPLLPDMWPDIQKNIEQVGFQVKDIKYILQDHSHRDHVAGIPALKALVPGAKALVMAQDFDLLADGGASDYLGNGKPAFTPVRADKILHDGEKVQLGGVTMVAHLTAGHTKGCTTWTTVAEENGKKYNVVISCSLRMFPGQSLINNPQYPTLSEDIGRTFKTVKKLPCDVMLTPGASMFDFAEKIRRMKANPGTNPFIDPAACKSYIAKYEKAYVDELAKEKAGGGAYAPPPDDPTQPDAILPCPNDGRKCYGAAPRPAGRN